MLIVNVSSRQWRLWHWVNMSVTLLMDHGSAKNTNIKTSIINSSSSWRYPQHTWLALMQRPRKKMGNEFTVNDHVLILHWFFFSFHIEIRVHWKCYCFFPHLTTLPIPHIWLWYLWREACGGYRPTIIQIIFPR